MLAELLMCIFWYSELHRDPGRRFSAVKMFLRPSVVHATECSRTVFLV